MSSLFAYGTLQVPAVFEAVTGRSITPVPATLAGYARYRLSGLTYPGLIEADGATTRGMLYCGLGQEEMDRLDAFEDSFYQRITRPVTTGPNSSVPAEIYLIPRDHTDLIDLRPWSLDEFCRNHLERFLSDRCF